ncbi:sulfite exporter TauE/SafE family protein [Vitreoscilla sp. C1]|uniref:sulfite exporter TauE/SafE family protein n=1 Tax=Vitreoscilla sp. (strain C1) TaxID=96942 RepID=UPI00148ED037|nr:sulfite exporter TauE/SafE family protein [Vitreoscilla sp. C1]
MTELLWMCLFAFLAGMMDAAVGGGGLVQIPALFGLLPANTPIATVMGTNKFASMCGTLTAGWQYVRKINVPWKMLLPAAALAFITSYFGSMLVSHIPVHWFKPFILLILVVMAIYTFCKKDFGQKERQSSLSQKEWLIGLACGALIGFYDGVIGPGTGSFLTFMFIRLFAFDFLTAVASSKIINITTNLAALSFFIPNDYILWAWAIPLAACNLSGGFIGTQIALRGGSGFLRYGFMLLLVILIAKFAYDLLPLWQTW